MAYSIRSFRDADAADLAEITLSAILTVGSRRYSAAQTQAWAARHPGPDRFVQRAAAGDIITVAADANDTPVAYVLLEPSDKARGHLDMLYCHPDHTRRGLAGQLLAAAQQQAVEMGMTQLFTEASELARPAFERAGYTALHRRDFDIDGVAIHNFAMEKTVG